MIWQIEFSPEAEKVFGKLDRSIQKQITGYLQKNILPLENPRLRGEGLKANLSGLWRYRVGDYRLICEIKDHTLTVLVVKIGHRRDIYSEVNL